MKPSIRYISEAEAVGLVGKGWEHLVRQVYTAREAIGVPVGILQVKERYGGLRIYTEYSVHELDSIIRRVGYESLKICEECGSPGILASGSVGEYKTRCETHLGSYTPLPIESLN
jgi:hypothetical protein